MRRIFLAALLVATVGLAAPAHAQDIRRQVSQCDNLDGTEELDEQVEACTALIDSHWRGGRALAEAHYRRAFAYYQLGDHAHALSDYSRSIALGRESQYSRGLANYAAGNYTAAIADFTHAIQANPKLVYAYFNRAVAFRAMGDARRANIEIDRLVPVTDGALDDESGPGALHLRCWSRAVVGRDLDAARAFCDRAIAETRNPVAGFFDTRGMLNLRQERWQEAWNDYDAAVQLMPTQSRFYYGRGLAALRLGRTEDGQADIDRAVAYNANMAQIYEDMGLTP